MQRLVIRNPDGEGGLWPVPVGSPHPLPAPGGLPHAGWADLALAPVGASADAKPDRRVVTVLFADIVGSTRLVASVDCEDASDRLAGILDLLHEQVRRFGGTLCQTLGDGVLALFGAPNAVEDHAVRACLAAEAMVRSVQRDSRLACQLRVGVCSGEVLWDAMARAGCTRPPAIGRAVHGAAKLQQSAAPNGVRICDRTALLAEPWVHSLPAGQVPLAPQDEIAAHTILGTWRRRRRLEDEAPLVGRDAELAVAQAAMDRVQQGRRRTLVLAGPPGIGKTHLSQHLVGRAQRQGLRVLEWQMHAVRPVGAPDALADLVQSLFERDVPDRRPLLVGMLAAGGVVAHRAEAMADLMLPDQRRPGMDPQGLLHLSAQGSVDMLRAASLDQPLMLLVEDVHWAGTDARAILEQLCTSAEDWPLFLLATSREERTELAGAEPVRLTAMDAGSARRLADLLVGTRAEAEPVKAALLSRAQGNPFFLTECVRALRDSGALAGRPGDHRVVDGAAADALPTTVRALLTARIDSLPPAERWLLLTASVLGQTFDAGLLAAVAGEPGVDGALQRLATAGLIDSRRLLPRLEYSFRHALLQETAYATLTRKDRKALHLRAAQLLDGDPALADMPNRLAALATHAFRAEWWEKAATAGFEAGKEALELSRAGEARDSVSLALKAEGFAGIVSVDSRVDVRLAMARTLMALGQVTSADGLLAEAALLAGDAGDSERRISALLMQCAFAWANGSLDYAIRIGNELIAESRANGAPLHFELLDLVAGPMIERGAVLDAIRLLEQAQDGARSEPQTAGRYVLMSASAAIQGKLAVAKALAGDPGWSSHAQEALASTGTDSRPFDQILSRLYVSEALVINGRFAEAASLCVEALDMTQTAGFDLVHPVLLARLGYSQISCGDARGLIHVDAALCSRVVRSSPFLTCRVATYSAAALAKLGRSAEAVDRAREALEVAETIGNIPRVITLRLILSNCLDGAAAMPARNIAVEQAQGFGLLGLLGMQDRWPVAEVMP